MTRDEEIKSACTQAWKSHMAENSVDRSIAASQAAADRVEHLVRQTHALEDIAAALKGLGERLSGDGLDNRLWELGRALGGGFEIGRRD